MKIYDFKHNSVPYGLLFHPEADVETAFMKFVCQASTLPISQTVDRVIYPECFIVSLPLDGYTYKDSIIILQAVLYALYDLFMRKEKKNDN